MAFTMKHMALLIATLGVISFIFGVVAENKKPPSGTPVTMKDVVVCKYPRDPTVALGYLSVVFLVATSLAGYFSLFYAYKGKPVPHGALFQSTGLLVFFVIAVGLTVMALTFLLWPTITEHLHLTRNVHHNLQTECPTAKTGLLGGGAFLSLNTALMWLVSLMLADNAREDYFDEKEGRRGGGGGERDVQLVGEYDDNYGDDKAIKGGGVA